MFSFRGKSEAKFLFFVVLKLMVELLLQSGKGAKRQRKETFPCFFASLHLCSENCHFTLILTSTEILVF